MHKVQLNEKLYIYKSPNKSVIRVYPENPGFLRQWKLLYWSIILKTISPSYYIYRLFFQKLTPVVSIFHCCTVMCNKQQSEGSQSRLFLALLSLNYGGKYEYK